MKRKGNFYESVINLDNLKLAAEKAQKGKKHYKEIVEFNKEKDLHLLKLHQILKNDKFKTSPYILFKVYEPKERLIYKLPYYPDRIVHHAIMNILENTFVSTFTSDTYSCIKGRGIHKAFYKLKHDLTDVTGTKYCLKLDVEKFYPSINNRVLKKLLRKKIKDSRLLNLLDEIIDSVKGVPIGNYLSQYFANFYLTYFDHWLKENKKVKYYYRYCDDLVILSSGKKELQVLLQDIKHYLKFNLLLNVKSNYQIFPTKARGINFIGYVFFHTHVLVRKKTKLKFVKMVKVNYNVKSINSYKSWLVHCNSKNLINKYLGKF